MPESEPFPLLICGFTVAHTAEHPFSCNSHFWYSSKSLTRFSLPHPRPPVPALVPGDETIDDPHVPVFPLMLEIFRVEDAEVPSVLA